MTPLRREIYHLVNEGLESVCQYTDQEIQDVARRMCSLADPVRTDPVRSGGGWSTSMAIMAAVLTFYMVV